MTFTKLQILSFITELLRVYQMIGSWARQMADHDCLTQMRLGKAAAALGVL